jgi:hypothetical protein
MDRHDHGVKDDERRWQDLQGGRLQQETFERPGTRLVLVGQFERIAGALQLSEGMTVLDLGCGVGHFLRWVIEQMRKDCPLPTKASIASHVMVPRITFSTAVWLFRRCIAC